MHIVLANGFGSTSNVGDHALLSASISLIKSAIPNAYISVLPWQNKTNQMKREFARLTTNFKSVELLDPILPAYTSERGFADSSLAVKAYIIAWTVGVNFRAEVFARYRAFTTKNPSFAAIQKSDLVILRGCNIVQRGKDIRAIASLRRAIFPLLAAKRAGKKTALLNISVGPIHHPYARSIVKRIIENADYISTREPLANAYLREFACCNPILSADSAFILSYADHFSNTPDEQLLGLNILSKGEYMSAVGNSGREYEFILQSLTEQLKLLLKQNPALKLLAIPHEIDHVPLTSDLEPLRNIVSQLGNSDRVLIADSANDTMSVIQAYSRCQLALGMRFHGYVLASLAAAPVLGIDLGSQKVTGVAKALGMDNWMIRLDEHESLVSRVEQALHEISELRTSITARCFALRSRVFDNFAAYARSLSLLLLVKIAT